jgi:hypothetical protein
VVVNRTSKPANCARPDSGIGGDWKLTHLKGRTATDAQKPFNQASLAMKTGDREMAVRLYQQVVDQLLPGDELWEQARRQLEALRR